MRKGTYRLLAFLLCGTMIFSGLPSAVAYAEDGQAQGEIAEVQGEDTNTVQGKTEIVSGDEDTTETTPLEGSESAEKTGSTERNESENLPVSDGEQATIAAEDGIMPIADTALPDASSIRVSYFEKTALYAPSDKTNVVVLRILDPAFAVNSLFDDPDVSFSLQKKGSDANYNQLLTKDMGEAAGNYGAIWWSLPSKLSEAGTYTLTITKDGESVSPELNVIEINFHAGTGTFPDREDSYKGYGSESAGWYCYDVPTPENEEGDFLAGRKAKMGQRIRMF